ncbi:MAG: cytochrome c5 family protein [Betaproteobacteria bacterium]|nr:cytochrome c5 family protein [Betaproteobacteria bacterium]
MWVKHPNFAKGESMKGTTTVVLAAGCALIVPSAALAADGKAVYSQVCAQCHAAGVAGAPKTSDKGAWAARIASGREAMLAAVLKGKGAMPPKGGNASLSDAEAKAAINYILQQIK